MEQNTSPLEHIALVILFVGIAFLLPIIFIPSLIVPFGMTKTVLAYGTVLTAFFLAVIAWLKKGSVTVPTHTVVLAAWGLAAAYAVAAFFSPNLSVSLLGGGAETDTFAFITVMALLLSLLPLLLFRKEYMLRAYIFLLAAFGILALFQALRLLFGADFLSFGVLTGTANNLLGKWNDLAIFFGLATIVSMMTLEGLSLNNSSKAVVYAALFVSLFFLVLINFFLVWLFVGLFALGFFVYGITRNHARSGGDMPEMAVPEAASALKRGGISVVALVVLVITIVFILFSDTAGSYLSNQFNISQIEARPSWQSTINVAQNTYDENLFFGSGPNTFTKAWAAFKTRDLNDTVFWNFDFNSGIGFVPTAFVTTGIVGGALWVLFLGLFLWSGFQALVLRGGRSAPFSEEGGGDFINYLTLSSFVGALYLFVMMVVYNPNAVLITLSFFLTGVFLASLRYHGLWRERTISFDANPRLGFISVLVLTILLILTAVTLFVIGVRYLSALSFQRGLIAANVSGDLVAAENEVQNAITLFARDRYHRTLADINLARLQQVAGGGDAAAARAELQTRITNAVENAQRATEIYAGNYQNWMTLGRVYASLVPLRIEGAYENATRAFDRARELNPHNPLIPYTLAQVEVVRGDNEAAKTRINEALLKKRNYTAAIFLLSQIQIQEGDLENAISSVEAGALLDPQNPVVFFQLGLLYYNEERDADAIASLLRAVSLNESYANARYFLGLAYVREGRSGDAVAQFERIAELNPDNAEVATILDNLKAGREPFDPAGVPATIGNELPIEGE